MLSIYKFFISLLVTIVAFPVMYGQQVTTVTKDTSAFIQFHGIRLDVDISPIVTNFLNGGNVYNYEAGVQVDINHKYYPVFEMGYAGATHQTLAAMNYQGNALFYRLGVDFNIIKQKEEVKKKLNNIFLVGGRLGLSDFNYNLTNIELTNDYWGNREIKNLNDIGATKLWYEIVVGIRVELAKNVFIGWSVRSKNLLNKDKTGEFKPWYIPGYGINGESGVWAFNYLLGYKF